MNDKKEENIEIIPIFLCVNLMSKLKIVTEELYKYLENKKDIKEIINDNRYIFWYFRYWLSYFSIPVSLNIGISPKLHPVKIDDLKYFSNMKCVFEKSE